MQEKTAPRIRLTPEEYAKIQHDRTGEHIEIIGREYDVPDIIYPDFEDGETELPEPLIIETNRLLILNDIHIGLHDNEALGAAINYGRKVQADTIIINGDLFDLPQFGKFSHAPDKLLLSREINTAKQFLQWLRNAFPKARIIFKKGNHDERYDRFIQDKAPQLYGLHGLTLFALAEMQNYGIEAAKDLQQICAGHLNIFHGHEIKKGGIHFAHNILRKVMSNVAVGHFHRTQYSAARTLNGSELGCWGIGCLCKLKMKYNPVADANHGFGFVEFSGADFEFNNKRIIYGKVV